MGWGWKGLGSRLGLGRVLERRRKAQELEGPGTPAMGGKSSLLQGIRVTRVRMDSVKNQWVFKSCGSPSAAQFVPSALCLLTSSTSVLHLSMKYKCLGAFPEFRCFNSPFFYTHSPLFTTFYFRGSHPPAAAAQEAGVQVQALRPNSL